MITWTESAKDKLENYLTGMRNGLTASGADPAEVTDDIRRHIAEEVTAGKLGVVTSDDVDRILRRIDAPEPARPKSSEQPRPGANPPPAMSGRPDKTHGRLHGVILFLGVLLPMLTLLIEGLTHMCAAELFDPIPTLGHVLLVASVPVFNAAAWWAIWKRKHRWRNWLGAANAFALVIAFYYTVLYLPLMPFAFIGLIFFGLGLLPLSPVLSLVAGWRLRSLLKQAMPGSHREPVGGLGWGLGGGALALALIALPIPLTRHWSHQFVTGTAQDRNEAIRRLRTFGHEKTLLTDCYSTRGWGGTPTFLFHRPVSTEAARSIYYRVTGRAFNSVPPPQHAFSAARWDYLDELSWDAEQGGTTVGGRLKGLSLAQSRLDGLIDADAGWAYTEWTLEFKNVASADREARAQIALPPGGVVSRLTLWVNGEEREAAFAGNGEVRQAYERVVKVERRDPVLVTSSGPDRVLMQCFPVPRNGGTIKVRLGVTTPLHIESEDSAVASWPRFIERNFGVASDFEHLVWVEARQPAQVANPLFKSDQSKPGIHALRAQLRDSSLAEPSSIVRLRRNPPVRESWVTDHRTEGFVVRQLLKPRQEPAPERIVLVVDGSQAMGEFFPQIAEAVRAVPEGIEIALVLASDEGPASAGTRQPGNQNVRDAIAATLRRQRGIGGQDNLPALLSAWDLAAEKPRSAIIWIHGPQPQLLDYSEAIQQRLDWRPASSGTGPVLHEIQTTPGPDRVIEKLNSRMTMRNVPRLGTLQEDLARLLASWRGEAKSLEWVRERVAARDFPENGQGAESSKHLVRLWAFDEVLRLISSNKRDAAAQLAGLYQLVTPVSGAVVLETRQQFEQAGLQPVDPQTVPMVPEPGTMALLILGACIGGVFWARRWRINARACLHSSLRP